MNTWRPQATCHPPNPFFYVKKIDLLKTPNSQIIFKILISFKIIFQKLQFLNLIFKTLTSETPFSFNINFQKLQFLKLQTLK